MKKYSLMTLALHAALYGGIVNAEQISGRITDKNGNGIAGVTVTLKGSSLKAVSNSTGEYELLNTGTGNKELHVSHHNYLHQNLSIDVPSAGLKNTNFSMQYTNIEVVDVKASPFHASSLESASPTTVLTGEQLRQQQAATIGETLRNQLGIHSNYHAGVSAAPIIRGLDGPRIQISQNGLDAGDASRIGPDHAIAADAATATQIEVLRGPATLRFGSGAIGGVVNVVDDSIPLDSMTRGSWQLERESVNNQRLGSVAYTSGTDSFAFHASGFFRERDDYRIPGVADIDEPNTPSNRGTVENSRSESDSATLGGTYLMDDGYIGVSYNRHTREYGIPGHSHGDGPETIYADLEVERYQLRSEYRLHDSWLRQINLEAGLTDYRHGEVDAGVEATVWNNDTVEIRMDLRHVEWNGWNGGLTVHYRDNDFEAQGAEAFTPPSTSEMLGLAWVEEKHFGDFLVQLGARVEKVTIDAQRLRLPQLSLVEGGHDDHDHGHDDHDHGHDDHDHGHDDHDHGHDDHDHGHDDHEHGHDDHDHGHGTELTRIFNASQEFEPVTLSAGLVWDFTDGYNAAISVSRAQRAPSAPELLSFGPHIGTGTVEVGALFEVEEHDGMPELGMTSQNIDLETSNNIDLTLRKFSGDLGFVFNLFYNQVDNYYFQGNTGLVAEVEHVHGDGHDHGHDDHAGHDDHGHTDLLPVFLFRQEDVTLRGYEAQVFWQVNEPLKATFFSDYVRASIDDGGDLPRTPPRRLGASLDYQGDRLTGNLSAVRYQDQTRIGENERVTDGYTLVDATISYRLDVANQDVSLYLRGTNLTDEEARVHASFLRDQAPLAGRSVAVGVRGSF